MFFNVFWPPEKPVLANEREARQNMRVSKHLGTNACVSLHLHACRSILASPGDIAPAFGIILGASGGHPGAARILESLGGILEHLGASWKDLGGILEAAPKNN